jgi:hypothetical protein
MPFGQGFYSRQFRSYVYSKCSFTLRNLLSKNFYCKKVTMVALYNLRNLSECSKCLPPT